MCTSTAAANPPHCSPSPGTEGDQFHPDKTTFRQVLCTPFPYQMFNQPSQAILRGPIHSLCLSLTEQQPSESPEDIDPNEHERFWGQRKHRAGSFEKVFGAEAAKPGKGGQMEGRRRGRKGEDNEHWKQKRIFLSSKTTEYSTAKYSRLMKTAWRPETTHQPEIRVFYAQTWTFVWGNAKAQRQTQQKI